MGMRAIMEGVEARRLLSRMGEASWDLDGWEAKRGEAEVVTGQHGTLAPMWGDAFGLVTPDAQGRGMLRRRVAEVEPGDMVSGWVAVDGAGRGRVKVVIRNADGVVAIPFERNLNGAAGK